MLFAGHVDDMFPYFLQHAKTMFPHLDCMDDLRKISDLRQPANWSVDSDIERLLLIYSSTHLSCTQMYSLVEMLVYNSISFVRRSPLRQFTSRNTSGSSVDLFCHKIYHYIVAAPCAVSLHSP